MVVEPIDAPLAQGAVSTPGRPDHLAVGAQTARLEGVQQRHELQVGIPFDEAGVGPDHGDVEDEAQEEQDLTAPQYILPVVLISGLFDDCVLRDVEEEPRYEHQDEVTCQRERILL